MLQPTVALELPATALPGLFAAKEIVLGVAVGVPTEANGIGESAGLKDWMTGVGRRGFSVVF
jgi:hypothetical protein